MIPKPDTIFLSTLSEDGCSFSTSNCCISSAIQGSRLPFTLPLLSSLPHGAVIPYLFEMLGGVGFSSHPLIFATTYPHFRGLHSFFKVYFGTWLSSSPSHHPPLSSAWWFHTHLSLGVLHQLSGSKTQNFLKQTQHFFHLQTCSFSTSFIVLLPCLQTSSVFLLTFSFTYTPNTHLLSASHVPGTGGYSSEKCRHGLLLSQDF